MWISVPSSQARSEGGQGEDEDEETNECYYYNMDTGDTVWEAPEGEVVRWKMLTDDGTGKVYYVDLHTGDTVWELPREAATRETTRKERIPVTAKNDKSRIGSLSAVGGMSEIGKQLRRLQKKCADQEEVIARMERKQKIAEEMKGVSAVGAKYEEALNVACAKRVDDEMALRMSHLRRELADARAKLAEEKSMNGQMKDAALITANQRMSMLELRIAELEEIEQGLRASNDHLAYQSSSALSENARLESENVNLRATLAAATAGGAAEVELLRSNCNKLGEEVTKLRADLQSQKSICEQLNSKLAAKQLEVEQASSRIEVQSAQIHDIEGQLASLQTAYMLIQEDIQAEERAKKQHEEDARLAASLQENAHIDGHAGVHPTPPPPPPRRAR